MNITVTLHILGGMLMYLAGTLLIPLAVSLLYADGVATAFILSIAICVGTGLLLLKTCNNNGELSVREGFAIVTFGWACFSLFGALPFYLSDYIPAFVDAFFETMSGFTTTGATILIDIEALPKSLLLWRALSHWLGGMGIIVLSLAILPMLGVGGMQLFKAEVPGPTADKLSPRIQDTAKLLWGVYVLLTLAETILLMFGGMDLFDAICHSFATLATGGFSTKNASVASYDSAYIDTIIIIFMFAAGINFSLHYQALRGRTKDYFRNEEFRFYLGITVVATLLLTVLNYNTVYDSIVQNIRFSLFQTVSILTTTGFGSADYEGWPILGQYILVFMMFVGGSAGSTGGGMKVARILLLFKYANAQLFRLIHPRAVRLVKISNMPVDQDVMQGVLGFFAFYMGMFVFASFLMASTGLDLVSAGASVIATMGNIGPGLGSVGPVDNYAHVSVFGKWVLSVCMLMGRLELFTVLVIFYPSFWRK